MKKKNRACLYPLIIMGFVLLFSFGCKKATIKPDAAFSCGGTTLTFPSGAVSFADNSKNSPTSWYWVFGDGGTSTDQNPVHTFYGSSYSDVYYTVTLTVSNEEGSSSLTIPNYIRVRPN